MAPLTEAVRAPTSSGEGIYNGNIDPDWTIGSVPNGGYALALILEACIQHQKTTKHHDPVHVVAHYLNATAVSSFEIRIKTLKTGRGFTNLSAELIQKDRLRISAHILFGDLTISPNSETPREDLLPPSPYARRIPLHAYPTGPDNLPLRRIWNFAQHIRTERDKVYHAQLRPDSDTRTHSDSVGGVGMEWAAWYELVGEEERITPSTLCFLTDAFPKILRQRPDLVPGEHWYPTVVMTIEFKSPIPKASEFHASRTVGLYTTCRFINDPQGRHDDYGEVWTAPRNLTEEGLEQPGWRDKQRCLAVTTQMALILPIAANTRNKSRL